MTLVPDWKKVIKQAWSIRLMVLAGLLTGCEAVLPLFSDSIPRNLFAVLTMLAIVGGMIMRVVAQKGMRDDD
jgi:uncharacterized membrane protein